MVDQEAIHHFSSINNSSGNKNNEAKEYYRYDIQIIDPGRKQKNKMRSLWYHRILYCLNNIKAGHHILLTDVDNIFTRHVSLSHEFLLNGSSASGDGDGYDAMFAFGGNFPVDLLKKYGFTICGGMTFLKASNGTIALMERLLQVCDSGTKRCDDQVCLFLL